MRYILYGCKGSGMASVSNILLDQGYEVIGIDTDKYVYTQDDLLKRNMKIYNFNEYQFNEDDILIYGHSFKGDKVIKEARLTCKEVYEYHEFVNKLAKKSKLSIAISGSHGKTYTTGLLSHILSKYKNISYLIGDGEGKYNGDDIFVFEACEYQDHFLIYEPDISIVLNIDYDHVDYFKNEEDYIESFNKFINKSKLVILNKNDRNIQKLNKIDNAKYYDINEIKELILTKYGYKFKYHNKEYITNVYGDKHVENILAIITLLDILNINNYNEYLINFFGVKRRFREIITNGDIYIDDYAHHHTQIEYTLKMIKNKYSEYELVVFFKPDRPSRFLTFYKQIATSLEQANYVVIMDFPSCNEEKVDVNLLVKENNKFFIYNKKIINKIRKIKKKVVVTFGSKNMQEVYENIFIKPHL